MKRKMTFIIIFVGLFLAISSRGEVYVAPNGPGPAPFASWATAAPDIQAAVNEASPGDTLLISNGVYTLATTISVSKDLTLRGVPAHTQPTIDGNQLVRCLAAASGTTVFLENL